MRGRVAAIVVHRLAWEVECAFPAQAARFEVLREFPLQAVERHSVVPGRKEVKTGEAWMVSRVGSEAYRGDRRSMQADRQADRVKDFGIPLQDPRTAGGPKRVPPVEPPEVVSNRPVPLVEPTGSGSAIPRRWRTWAMCRPCRPPDPLSYPGLPAAPVKAAADCIAVVGAAAPGTGT